MTSNRFVTLTQTPNNDQTHHSHQYENLKN